MNDNRTELRIEPFKEPAVLRNYNVRWGWGDKGQIQVEAIGDRPTICDSIVYTGDEVRPILEEGCTLESITPQNVRKKVVNNLWRKIHLLTTRRLTDRKLHRIKSAIPVLAKIEGEPPGKFLLPSWDESWQEVFRDIFLLFESVDPPTPITYTEIRSSEQRVFVWQAGAFSDNDPLLYQTAIIAFEANRLASQLSGCSPNNEVKVLYG